jgi:hypothetical protein
MPMDKKSMESEDMPLKISQAPGIVPMVVNPERDDLPTGQVRMIDNGPAKPTGPKKGFAK